MTPSKQTKQKTPSSATTAGTHEDPAVVADHPSPFTSPAIRMLETRLELPVGSQPSQPVRCALDVTKLLRELIGDADREHFVALYLNARNVLTHVLIVSRGTTQSALVHPREVFKGACLANSAAIIIAHNHPSGDIKPSPEDYAIHKRLREAGELLGIEVLDSLVVGPGTESFSMNDCLVLHEPQSREGSHGS